jgi:hypothetical protein
VHSVLDHINRGDQETTTTTTTTTTIKARAQMKRVNNNHHHNNSTIPTITTTATPTPNPNAYQSNNPFSNSTSAHTRTFSRSSPRSKRQTLQVWLPCLDFWTA